MVRGKTFFANKHRTFFAKVWCFCLFLFAISFFWYAQAIQLFLIGCLLTLKCFPFNLTSLLTDLLPGPTTSISPLERLSSSDCTNSWAKILSPYLNLSRLTKVVVVLQHCNFLSLVDDLHIHIHVYHPWLHVHVLCIHVHALSILFFVHVDGDFLLWHQ